MSSNNTIHTIELQIQHFRFNESDDYGPGYYSEDWFENL